MAKSHAGTGFHRRQPGVTGPRHRDVKEPRNLTETYLDDQRIDEIAERVIAFLHSTDVEEWTKNQWTLFQSIWRAKSAAKKPKTTSPVETMSREELLKTLSVTSSDDP